MASSGMIGGKGTDLIALLLEGHSASEAARRAGVPERTMRRWMADPGFQRRLQEHQEETIKQVRRRIVDRTLEAADTLGKVVSGALDGNAHQVSAAKALLTAFVALQPKQWQADIYTSDTPVIDYRFEGIDPEVLR